MIRAKAVVAALGVLIAVWLPSARASGRRVGGFTATVIRVYENPAVIQGLVVRPSQITLAADGNYTVTGLRRWKGWGSSTASAEGINHVNDCIPNCAGGHVSRVRVTVQLSRRGHYRGHYVYECYAVKPAAAVYLRHFWLP